MTTILVGTDASSAADMAVEQAARLAAERDGDLLVLYVRDERDARAVVDPKRAPDPGGYLDGIGRRFPEIRIRTRVEPGEPADRICAVAAEEEADTIVIGNRGAHGSWWRVKESVPNLVLRHAPCSVYVVDTRVAQ